MHVLTLIKTNSRTPDMEERENREKAYAAHGGKCGSLHHPGFSSVILSPISNTEFRTCKNKILGKGRNTEFRTCRNKILGEEGGERGRESNKAYLWTSLSPLLFVICHVNPLLGSRPGWEISKPCFFTNSIYLEDHWKQNTKKCKNFQFDQELSLVYGKKTYFSPLKCFTSRSSSHIKIYS